ncbi:hypothetical protein [Terrabacter sp. Root181]|uniref:hypothetical protein n=1 Tax=Terrabacter sp. Root181 TaxID=1736484 RepID=UPI000A4737AD|nr:hypothetical protein [Terrabacter sp. Root181]
MTWTRLSDDYSDRLDLLGLSRSARLLDVEGLVWCNRNTTDGYLPRAALRKVTDSEDPAADVAELVAAGRWDDAETGWQLDWSDQEKAEDVQGRREEWRRRDDRRRRHNKGDHSACDPQRCWALTRETPRETTGESRPPVPGPVPLPTLREGEGGGAGARSARATRSQHQEADDPRLTELLARREENGHAFNDDGSGLSCQGVRRDGEAFTGCGLGPNHIIHIDGGPR